MGHMGTRHIIDKLNISNYSRPALIGGLALMMLFGAFPNNQNALATNTETEFLQTPDGEIYELFEFFLAPSEEGGCDTEHWHATFGVAVSIHGVELEEFFEFCGYGEELPGVIIILTTCDNPGEVCRAGVGICEEDAVCTSDGFCPDNEFIVDLILPCNLLDDPW
jgi:hypothetical protein